jgi:hypothetical protein
MHTCLLRATSGTTTASPALIFRGIHLQIGIDAARIQSIAPPEDPRAVIEFILRNDAITPHAVRRHHRRVSARDLEQERAGEDRGHRARGRDGMLFGSELVEGQRMQHVVFIMTMEQRVGRRRKWIDQLIWE